MHKIEKGPSAGVSSSLRVGIENGVRLAGRREKPEIRIKIGKLGHRELGDVGLRSRRILASRQEERRGPGHFL